MPLYQHLECDAAVVGSGPNGLAAAIALAQQGLSVIVFEGSPTIGGGLRSAELTLPGFIHDVCSAIHPLGYASPFFSTLPLEQHGLEWIQPPVPLAHPFDDGAAVLLEQSIKATGSTLGPDAEAYASLMEWLSENWNLLVPNLLGPFRFPQHPLAIAHFSFYGLRSGQSLANSLFKEEKARGLFAGLAAHSIQPLSNPLTAAFGLILGVLGHITGWPFPKGGSQQLTNALASYFQSLGGKIITDANIETIDQLPKSRVMMLDVTPRQLLNLAGSHLPSSYKRRLEEYRYGPGVCKVDWALSNPIPWKAVECARAGTVHLGGTLKEIAASEAAMWSGKAVDKPFILLAQQSLFDPTRAPQGKQTAWAYCHVPHGSSYDMTKKMEAQIERFAPGFKSCILAKSTKTAVQLERYNPNCIGGDINGGVQDLRQLYTRPVYLVDPYSTPVEGLYLCSSSTPPGGGVHGMCGYHAAQSAIRKLTKNC